MRTEIKTSCLKRLKRIEGQIRGLAGMVEDDRYCIDVVTQISAAKAALRRVEEEILRDHVAHCVEHAISSGDKADQRRKIAELMDVVSRSGPTVIARSEATKQSILTSQLWIASLRSP
jgi:CsoR family transcriptional regulator, copper-sensing transcriptional repressor